MLYSVIFLLSGEEQTDTIDASDAASAVARAQFDHGRGEDQFELISVTVIDSETSDEDETED